MNPRLRRALGLPTVDEFFRWLTGHREPILPRCESRGMALLDRLWLAMRENQEK